MISKIIDHTILKPDTTREQIVQLVAEAKKYKFASVCVNPNYTSLASKLLKDTPEVKVCTVIGFPLGATTTAVKVFEAEEAVKNGAEEVDMVINIAALKDGLDNLVEKDIKAVVDALQGQALVKVIIETCLLTDEEKIRACHLAVEAGADFVKTSTGFSISGATIEDVRLMRKTVGPKIGVKAAGGIRTLNKAQAMIEAGANRIGSSSGVSIIDEERRTD